VDGDAVAMRLRKTPERDEPWIRISEIADEGRDHGGRFGYAQVKEDFFRVA